MKAILLLDSSFLIYRAWHSLKAENFKDLNENYTNAVYGFTKSIKTLLNIFKEYSELSIIACFDSNSKNQFRKQLHEDYKNTRTLPNGLGHQFKLCKNACKALNIPIYSNEAYEADDLIASLSCQLANDKNKVIIVSCDKDMYQLINDNVYIFNIIKKVFIKKKEVYEKFNVYPNKMIMYQAIVGDSCDNIKGIKGIGPKTAHYLVNYDHDHVFDDKKLQRKFVKLVEKFNQTENQEIYQKNLKLVSLIKDIDLGVLNLHHSSLKDFKTNDWKLFTQTVNFKF
jgi:DNA polymerase-1